MPATLNIPLTRRSFAYVAGAAFSGVLLRGTAVAADRLDMRRALGGDGDITELLLAMRRGGVTQGWLPAGSYTVSPGTSIDGLSLEGAGTDTILTAGKGGRAPYLLEAVGSARALPPLARSAKSGDKQIVVGGRPGCRPGDLIEIFDPHSSSFSHARGLYRNGEFAQVIGVEGSHILLRAPLTRDAGTGVAVVRLLVPAKANLKAIRIESGDAGALRCSRSHRVRLDNVAVHNAASHGIYLDRCFEFTISDLVIDNAGSGSASDYGLAIGNSQAGLVSGGSYYGRRHGIALGGGDFEDGVPTRDVTVEGARISNLPSAGTPAADMHGNCERITYRNCSIRGGATLGGADGAYVGCQISAMTNGTCIYGAEILGGEFIISDCTLSSSSDPSAGYRGIVDLGGNSIAIGPDTQRPIRLIIRDCHVEAKGLSGASRIVELRNRGARFPIDVDVAGLTLDVNSLGSVVSVRDQTGHAWRGDIKVAGIRGKPISARDVLAAR